MARVFSNHDEIVKEPWEGSRPRPHGGAEGSGLELTYAQPLVEITQLCGKCFIAEGPHVAEPLRYSRPWSFWSLWQDRTGCHRVRGRQRWKAQGSSNERHCVLQRRAVCSASDWSAAL